ncbi:MAG TPA: methyltransferase domain-containing protein [Acidimicrobiales bacterium]|jgi:SAM-dependent methyltransferase|nr:methyltransferase domain-containing protein [Acidimicrobiales bacterium]
MAGTVVNVAMADAWDGDEGEEWARDWPRYDRAVRGYHRRLLDAAAISVSDRVLDIGCGNGETSRDAARAAANGFVLGVDLSSRMLERARELARAEGLANVRFEHADAQAHPFEPSSFDVALSRFGTMFFADQQAAFANIGAALRPGAALVMVGWRVAQDNEWLRCVLTALAVGRELPVPPPGAPGPFGLADVDLTRAALTAAGFDAIVHTPVDEPFWLGSDGEDAYAWFRGTAVVRGMTQGLADTQRADALDALRTTLFEHDTGDGVNFGSGAWLVSARWRAR